MVGAIMSCWCRCDNDFFVMFAVHHNTLTYFFFLVHASVYLFFYLIISDDGAQTHKYPGYPTTSPIEITSVGFPQYSVVSNAIHNYSFQYTDHSRYVRIVFSDFFIHSNCVLKVRVILFLLKSCLHSSV